MTEQIIITTESGKVFSKGDIYTALDIQTTRSPSLKEEGYFADSLEELMIEIGREKPNFLTAIDRNDVRPFRNDYFHYYSFFLPATRVKATPYKKKEYRPFKTMEEFKSTVTPWDNQYIGRCVYLREKNNPENQVHLKLTGFGVNAEGLSYIVLGDISYTPETLFKCFEFKGEDQAWHQLGVEVKDA